MNFLCIDGTGCIGSRVSSELDIILCCKESSAIVGPKLNGDERGLLDGLPRSLKMMSVMLLGWRKSSKPWCSDPTPVPPISLA